MVLNNQVGFTTLPNEGRSTLHCTDVAKFLEVPIIHANADDPDAVVQAFQLAVAWRQHFRLSCVIDLVGYRRHGHNELDDPSITQPQSIARIASHPRVRDLYLQACVARGVVSEGAAEHWEVSKRTQGHPLLFKHGAAVHIPPKRLNAAAVHAQVAVGL